MRTIDKICLIDDDQFYLFSMRRMIEINQLCGTIAECKNGQEAINYISNSLANKESLPDVIFLDINMPIMNGWEFLDAYQKLCGNSKKTGKVYVVSSSIDSIDKAKAKTYKVVTGYVIKPVSVTQLKELLV
ncbi:response regulator [Foetidibacter luteolus]|uniref:response regulator n=1 Tax=Foetidibacter luteolus TaxID=2608880 RepID=UPI00129A5E58|nr:response regulator [Foetidibacter luteolus]